MCWQDSWPPMIKVVENKTNVENKTLGSDIFTLQGVVERRIRISRL